LFLYNQDKGLRARGTTSKSSCQEVWTSNSFEEHHSVARLASSAHLPLCCTQMSFLKAVEVTNAVFIILNSTEGLKEHLRGVLFCDRGKWPFLGLNLGLKPLQIP